MVIDEDILKELKKISKIMLLSNDEHLEKALTSYASNDDRKKIWVLIDGKRQADDIVKISGLTKSPVYAFLKNLEDVGLIERQRGKPPTRLLDYVPAKWVEMIQTNSLSTEKETQSESPMQEANQALKENSNG